MGSVSVVGRVVVDRAVCDHVLALVGSRRRRGGRGKKEGREIREKEREKNILSNSPNAFRHACV